MTNFPILESELVYLDSAASTQKPKIVLERINTFYSLEYANVHRGLYALSEKATDMYENSRTRVAKFIGAQTNEIIFTSGTTASINLLANSLRFTGKNNIVVSSLEHHANLLPWQQYCKRNKFELRVINMKNDLTLDLDDAKEKIDAQTAILAVCHISNAFGVIHPVRDLCKLALEKGALSVIDAAQSIQHLPINVLDIGCDFLAFSGHKCYGPTGIGVLYGRADLLENMDPSNFGGEMVANASYTDAIWTNSPHKFEAGTPHIAGAIGLSSALDYISAIGFKSIQENDKELAKKTRTGLAKIPGVTLHGTSVDQSGPIVAFSVANAHPHDVSAMLAQQKICVRGGHHCAMPAMQTLGLIGTVRVSFGIYNADEDVDAFLEAMQNIVGRFT